MRLQTGAGFISITDRIPSGSTAINDRDAKTILPSTLRTLDFFPSIEEIAEKLSHSPEVKSLRRLVAIGWALNFSKATRGIAAEVHKALDIPLSQILISAWNKCQEIKEAQQRTRLNENITESVLLLSHTVEYEFSARVEILQSKKVILRLTFPMHIDLNIKAVMLEIEKGTIQAVSSGELQVTANLKCGQFEIAKKELPPFRIAGTLQWETADAHSAHSAA